MNGLFCTAAISFIPNCFCNVSIAFAFAYYFFKFFS